MLDKAASFHKDLIFERGRFDAEHLEEENHRLSIELAIAREQEKAAQERATHLARANAALQKTIDALGSINSIEDFIPLVLKIVLENFQAISCAFFEHADENLIYLRYWLIEGQVLTPTEILALDPDKYALIIRLAGGFTAPDEYLGTHPRYRVHAVQLDHAAGTCVPEFDDFCRACGWESELNVPCVIGDVAEGALVIYRGAGLAYSECETALAETLSAQLALALQTSRLAEEAKQAAVAKLNEVIAREQEKAAQERTVELLKANVVLTNTLDRLAKEPDPNAFLGYLLLEIVQQVAACKVHVFLYDAATNTLEQTISVQDGKIYQPYSPNDPFLFHAPFAADITPAWQLLIEQQKIIVTAGNQFTEMHWPETIAWHRTQGHRLRATLALMVGKQPAGLLAIAFRDRESLQQAELDLIRALANQATLAIQLTRLAEEAKHGAVAKLIAREQEQAARQRAAELAKANHALRRSIARLTTANSLQLFLNAVLKETFQTSSGVNGAAVFDYEPASHTVQLLGLVISGEVIDIASDPRAEIYRSPIPSEAAGDWHIPDPERRIVWIDIDDPVLLRTPEAVLWHKQQGHQRLNVIPLFSGEQPLGFLGLAFTTRTPPSDAQIEHWWALAQHVGLALRLANLAEEAKQTAILDERNRMARDIHDTLAQSFTGIIMQLEALKSSPMLSPEETQAHLNRIRDSARLGLSEARRSVQALRPVALETASFPEALRHLLNQMTQGTPAQITLHIEGMTQSLPASVEENLLRIAQEAVTNAIRHGQAQTIALQLLFEPTAVHLQIMDDGQGFTPATHLTSGFGLIGMQERVHHLGGHLHLVSQPGQGTEITVTIPSKG